MAGQKEQGHWLDKYATNHAAWKIETDAQSGEQRFRRPLGLVETSFDIDGACYGGRAGKKNLISVSESAMSMPGIRRVCSRFSVPPKRHCEILPASTRHTPVSFTVPDVTALFTLAIRHTLSKGQLRQRIATAWTSLCLQHPLLMSRIIEDQSTSHPHFAINIPQSTETATQNVEKSIVFMEDSYPTVDGNELYHHAYNVARIIEPKERLSRLHVLPLTPLSNGTLQLCFLIVIAHQISDGLSAYNWFSHFTHILNLPASQIETDIHRCRMAEEMRKKLPAAQEDLYPPIAGNKARQRWFWVLIRVLRHVKATLPPTFENPLRREKRLEEALPLEPKFDKVFDYRLESRPPMSCGHISASLSPPASSRFLSLCRSANVSIGAGCFALAGLAMMSMHESRYPHIPDAQRRAFTAAFPLNPRAFFANPPAADSCMLAFSEGIVMPFLPSRLPVEGRFKLVAKHANRELRVYQKRLKRKTAKEGVVAGLDKHAPGRLLATGYVAQMELVEAKLPPGRRTASYGNPQGELPRSASAFGATCAVSSIGPLAAFLKRGMYDISELGEGRDFAADFWDTKIGVRARDNEFLVGSSTSSEGIVGFGVSYDLNAISEEAAELWKGTIEGLLEESVVAKL